MQRIRPVLTHTRRRAYAAVALLLGFASWPALAASGINPLCDDDETLPTPPDELTVDTVDHVPIIDDATMPLGIVDPSPPALASTTPRVDHILRQIFDETPPDNAASDDSSARSTAAPLVELRTPDLVEDTSDEFRSESMESQGDVPAPMVDPRFPGLSDADAERYRRQMYRTDI